MANISTAPNIPLSATRIKTLQGCSWRYYSQYILRLPEQSNSGASCGTICHTVFECLGNPRHLKHYNTIAETGKVFTCKPVRRLVVKWAQRLGVDNYDDLEKICKMIVAGIRYDFFGKEAGHGKPSESLSEVSFDMTVQQDGKNYTIRGFIDKLFLFKKKRLAIIRDFKSSKKKFSGQDLEDNIQHQIYALAISKLYPKFLRIHTEFAFLQFMLDNPQDGVVAMDSTTKDESDGFEHFLTEIQAVVNQFDQKDAQSHLAKHKEFTTKEGEKSSFPIDGSFSGKLLCGFNKYKGQLKKDGTLMWGCPYKFGFEYYSVRDKSGKILKTYLLDDADKIDYDADNGQVILLEKYDGCPAWN